MNVDGYKKIYETMQWTERENVIVRKKQLEIKDD